MEWYLTCQRFTTFRNKKKKKRYWSVCCRSAFIKSHTCNMKIIKYYHSSQTPQQPLLGAQGGEWIRGETSTFERSAHGHNKNNTLNLSGILLEKNKTTKIASGDIAVRCDWQSSVLLTPQLPIKRCHMEHCNIKTSTSRCYSCFGWSLSKLRFAQTLYIFTIFIKKHPNKPKPYVSMV